jgi:transcriptional regulator GlxA family with amidase domain
VLDRVIIERCAVREMPAVAPLWRTLYRTGGTADIAGLANRAGWSHRHLIDRFRRQIGLSPKVYARVVRFQRALRMVERDTAGLSEIAMASGYYDQAHLNRDFRRFAGATPVELRNRLLTTEFGFAE